MASAVALEEWKQILHAQLHALQMEELALMAELRACRETKLSSERAIHDAISGAGSLDVPVPDASAVHPGSRVDQLLALSNSESGSGSESDSDAVAMML